MYEDGFGRIEKEFDIVKIIKGLRDIKIITKEVLMDKVTKVKVQNDGNNVINIDSEGADPDESVSNSDESFER